jgi:hypothetical protein
MARIAAVVALHLWLTASAPAALRAQAADSSTAPFSTISLRAAALSPAGRDRLHDWWRPASGAELEGSTPFPVGEVAVAIARIPFRSLDPAQPDFDATIVSLRWGLARRVGGPAVARMQLTLGDFMMHFKETTQGLTQESELLVGAGARLDLRLARWLALSGGAGYQRVLTRVPIQLVTFDAGARLSAPTPRWLRGVLE